MDFGSKIQMLRKSQGISQENLAAILKINRTNLSRIETGKSEPTLSIIKNIVNYGYRIYYLRGNISNGSFYSRMSSSPFGYGSSSW